VGSVHKISKVLASRLTKVLGKVVGPHQHAFIAGRQILDAALIANGVLTLTSNLIFAVLSVSSTLKKPMIICLGTFL